METCLPVLTVILNQAPLSVSLFVYIDVIAI